MEQIKTSSDSSWAKLSSLNGVVDLEIAVDKFTIGRSKRNNLCLKQNMHVSSEHCYIMRDPDGLVWICDTSSNGTMVNNSVKVQNDILELHHGDTIHLVLKESDSSKNVAYKLLLKSMLHPEESDAESGGTADEEDYAEHSTMPIDIEIVDFDAEVEKGNDNANTELDTDEGPPSKRLRGESVKFDDCASTKPKQDCASITGDMPDKMEEGLECSICKDIIHNCVSAQPCLHSFCAHCLLDWRKESQDCPTCRSNVQTVAKNHLVNNLIEVYLLAHPDKARDTAELVSIDRKVEENKHILFQSNTDGGGASNRHFLSPHFSINRGLNMVNVGFISHYPQARMTCRYCQWSAHSLLANHNTQSRVRDESSAPGSTTNTATFQCGPNQTHVFCQCCHKPMPDRRGELTGGDTLPVNNSPPQACTQCNQLFCHQLWTCDAQGCLGCLSKLKDLRLPPIMPYNFILQSHETQILQAFLNNQNITLVDMLSECFDKLSSGEFTLSGQVTTDTFICYRCGMTHLKELAYQYRASLPANQLPAAVTARRNCWYGRRCRTQFTSPSHATGYNHICEQTRFT